MGHLLRGPTRLGSIECSAVMMYSPNMVLLDLSDNNEEARLNMGTMGDVKVLMMQVSRK